MLKKKYMTFILAVTVGLAMVAGGCGAKSENDVQTENSSGDAETDESGETSAEESDSEVENSDGKTGDNDSAIESEADLETEEMSAGLTFTTQDIYGETVTEDIFKEYDLTLVNCFATWCSPCIAEMPELAQLHETMAEKKVNVVAVCLDSLNNEGEVDEDAVSLAKQIAEYSGAEFTFLVPDEMYFGGRLSGIQAVPESFFVDGNGNIVGETYVGARDLAAWTEIVEQELANLAGN